MEANEVDKTNDRLNPPQPSDDDMKVDLYLFLEQVQHIAGLGATFYAAPLDVVQALVRRCLYAELHYSNMMCAYCNARFHLGEDAPTYMGLALVFQKHIDRCPDHPMSDLRAQNESLRVRVAELERQLNERIADRRLDLDD